MSDLTRQIDTLVKIGIVDAVDFAGPSVRAMVRVGALLTDWLSVMQLRAGADRTVIAPSIGEQVVILSPGGDLAQGIIIGSLAQADAPAPALADGLFRTLYGDGALIEYDRYAHRLSLRLPPGAMVQIEAPGGIQIIGDVSVQGRITSSGDQVAAGISLLAHTHISGTTGTATSEPHA